MADTITAVPTVKAYPALLRDLEEAVCVAGFRTGLLQQPEWVRLFPVPFRELGDGQQFRKWQEITVQVERTARDRRPESFLPHSSTISAGLTVPVPGRRWLVQSMPHVSMCDLQERQMLDGSSLGVVRPRRVIDVHVEERDRDEVLTQQRRVRDAAAQQKLFGPDLKPLEVLPHKFRYRYLCESPECTEHRQMIVDWEISQAYRKWRHTYPDVIAEVRNKWLHELCGPGRDTRFFVGNMHQHLQSFLVLGVFAPTKR